MLKTASSNKQSPHWKKNRLEVLKGCRAPAHVFPARAGMSQMHLLTVSNGVSVFPARAGMSPSERKPYRPRQRVPRASGDEPVALMGTGAAS